MNKNKPIKTGIMIFLTFLVFHSYGQIPLAHYDFNGNTDDISGNLNHITFSNATYNGSGAYTFNGVDNYMIPPAFGPFSEFTLVARVKYSSEGLRNIFSGVSAAWYPSVFNGGIRWYDGVNWRVSSKTSLNDNEWHEIAFVFQNGVHKIYIDGVFEYQDDEGTYSEGTITTIGSIRGQNQRFFEGDIDLIKIYSLALTEIEITKSFADFSLINENCGFLYCSKNGISIGSAITPQGYLFSVDGKMISEEVKVQLSENWPDFVFKRNYELRTLEEVEQYISENKHLPEIPSEAEVAENGINLGEMNAKLLQKIEELTLYLIEQNKDITEMKKEISALKNE